VADLGSGDVAVVVGLRRRPAGFGRLVSTLAATGADVALIADRSVRQSPAAAAWTLIAAVETPDALDSYAGAMALARRIALETGRRLGAEGRRRLDRIETLHEALGELE
jgi:DNA-binding MurR/RpiR family transcriptional regulator